MKPAHPVKVRRVVLGMTQRELAERAGVNVATIVRIESGRTAAVRQNGPQRATRRRLAKTLQAPQDWLFPSRPARARPAEELRA